MQAVKRGVGFALNPRLSLLGEQRGMALAKKNLLKPLLIGALGTAIAADLALAQDRAARPIMVEAAPAALADIHRVSASDTPSGFAVPRYVSLKFGTVNARTGPSLEHSIAYQYRRRGLPLVVVAETEMWRKVRDISGDEAWVKKAGLSGERRAIALDETLVRAKASGEAKTVARLQKNAVVELGDCADGYCRVETRGGLKGYVRQWELWGAAELSR